MLDREGPRLTRTSGRGRVLAEDSAAQVSYEVLGMQMAEKEHGVSYLLDRLLSTLP